MFLACAYFCDYGVLMYFGCIYFRKICGILEKKHG